MTKPAAEEDTESDAWKAHIEEMLSPQNRIEELAKCFDRADTSDPATWEEATDVVLERPRGSPCRSDAPLLGDVARTNIYGSIRAPHEP